MRKISALLLLAHILVLPLVAQSQSTKVLSDYIKEINQFNKRNPQEKVYLHFDNTGYFLGDTIWFKAYNVLAEHHRFSPLSKVLHVELLTPTGRSDSQSETNDRKWSMSWRISIKKDLP